MLPSIGDFNQKVGQLGISHKDHIICYDSYGIFSSARVFWTFKCFGHEKIQILDGGLPKWTQESNKIESGDVNPKQTEYCAIWKPELVRNYSQILENLEKQTAQIIDARPKGRFDGSAPEPRADLSSGHMPNSINIPFSEIIDPNSKTMLPVNELKTLFDKKGIDLTRPIITSCGSGVTASMLYAALKEVGANDVSVYDGSWTEYAGKPGSKIIKK
jgi:thiosulfate/3-mercaptopyruvate sulfurtransferase